MILTVEIRFTPSLTGDVMRAVNRERYARVENHIAGYVRFAFETENYNHLRTSIPKLLDSLPDGCRISWSAKNRTPRYDPVKDYIRRGPIALTSPKRPQPEPVRWDLRFLDKYTAR